MGGLSSSYPADGLSLESVFWVSMPLLMGGRSSLSSISIMSDDWGISFLIGCSGKRTAGSSFGWIVGESTSGPEVLGSLDSLANWRFGFSIWFYLGALSSVLSGSTLWYLLRADFIICGWMFPSDLTERGSNEKFSISLSISLFNEASSKILFDLFSKSD